jgi:hypothetical protein
MYVIISLPPGPKVLTALPQYWTQYLFRGTPSELYEVNALDLPPASRTNQK